MFFLRLRCAPHSASHVVDCPFMPAGYGSEVLKIASHFDAIRGHRMSGALECWISGIKGSARLIMLALHDEQREYTDPAQALIETKLAP